MSNGLVQPIVKWDETINLAHQAGYLLGQADSLMKCAGKIAELQKQVARESERGVEYLEGLLEINPKATLASTLGLIRAIRPPELDDDPLTMPVKQLRECVAVEVMGWHKFAAKQKDGSVVDWWLDDRNVWLGHCVDSCPDTNPALMQMVKDKMREREFNWAIRCVSVYRHPFLATVFGIHDGKVQEVTAYSEGEAICRAALLAVRYLPKEEGVGDHDA